MTTFATNKSIDDYKAEIERYLNTDYDFMGIKGERLYFQLRKDYTEGKILKTIAYDIKTLDIQLKTTKKNLKDNKDIYALLAGLGGLYKFKYLKVVLKPI